MRDQQNLPTDSFEVHTDRAAIRRLHGRAVALSVIPAVLYVAIPIVTALLVGTTALVVMAPLAIAIVAQLTHVVAQAYLWGGRAAIPVPLVVTADGLRFVSPSAVIDVGWSAISHISVQRRWGGPVIRFDLRPEEIGTLRVEGTPLKVAALRRHGLQLGSRGVHESVEHISAALVHFSGGRVGQIGPWPAAQVTGRG